MHIVTQYAPYSSTYLLPPLLLPAPKRPHMAGLLSAPKIAGYLPAPQGNTAGGYLDSPLRHPQIISGRQRGTAPNVVKLEVAQTPENQARMADSFEDFLRSLGPWLTMDDAYAVIERHNRAYEERRAKREAENARYMAALNDWWNQYLAAPNNKTRQALLAARPSILQAAEVSS